MRVTRETLLKNVQEAVANRTRSDRTILAIYLHGSLLEDDFLLGGAGDADLFFIHADAPQVQREIVHLTDDIHLDIAHINYRDYRQTRKLRVDPWAGPTLKSCKILYDPQHIMDFTQASVGGQFDRPDHMLERARTLEGIARRNWTTLHAAQMDPNASEIHLYLDALENAANAVIGLNGMLLTERRFLQRLSRRADATGRPGIYPGLMGLLGANLVDRETIKSWLPAWQLDYSSLPADEAPARLHPTRLPYYLKACESLIGGDQPQQAVWPLLRTWTRVVKQLPDSPAADWRECVGQLGLLGKSFSERLSGLDSYLDMVNETLDQWATANGAVE